MTFSTVVLLALATFIRSSVSQNCLGNTEKYFKGICFNLVNKQLSYEEARSWCHHQNPSTPAYLATVSDPNTAANLASWARNFFGHDDHFWIGLSRPSPSDTYSWDSGYPVGFTYFNVQNASLYVAETTVNGKWDTFGADAKFAFFCSYNPKAPPSFPPEATTTATSACLPTDPTTLFFAYSNDLNANIVTDVLYYFNKLYQSNDIVRNYTAFATVRFDLADPENVKVYSNLKDLIDAVNHNLPDPELALEDSSAPSDVIDIVRNYAHDYPTCGSVIMLLVQRNPDDQDISELVTTIQENYFMVYTAASNQLIGPPSTKSLYDLSTRTNGVCTFSNDLASVFSWHLDFSIWYPIYAVNVKVNGQGSKQLPDVYFPPSDTSVVRSGFTVQSHPFNNDYFWLEAYHDDENWMNATNPRLQGKQDFEDAFPSVTWRDRFGYHSVSLTFNYPTTTETVQYRYVSQTPSPSGWPAYDQNY